MEENKSNKIIEVSNAEPKNISNNVQKKSSITRFIIVFISAALLIVGIVMLILNFRGK